MAGVLLGALMFRGWSLSGHLSDWWPCLLTAIVVAGLVRVAGRLPSNQASLWCAVCATCGVVGGKVLAWDLLGVVDRFQGNDLSLLSNRLERAADLWSSLPVSVRWANGLTWVLTPVLSAVLVPVCSWALQTQSAPSDDSAREVSAGGLPTRVRPAVRWLTLAWLVTVATLLLVRGGGERGGFRLLTDPCDRLPAGNSLLGFSVLLGERPVNAEALPAIEQVEWFSGSVRSDNNFRFLRAGYAFMGAQLAPLFGAERALVVVNVLAWLCCLFATWRLSRCWFDDDLTGCLAVIFAAVGIGFAIHLHATTPHLWSFALYYLGVLVLARAGIIKRRQPWRVQLGLGLLMGFIGLSYNVSVMLLFVYLLSGWRTQRTTHLLMAAGLSLLPRIVWSLLLPALGINVLDVEREYLVRTLEAWIGGWHAGPAAFLQMILHYTLESFLSMESPLILLLGAVGWLTLLRGRRRWFAGLVIAAPVLACTFFAPSAEVRGYVVYGGSIMLFVMAGRLLSLGLRASTMTRRATLLLLFVALGTHAGWGTAHLWGWLGPAKTYFLGWDDGLPVLRHGPTRAISVTGHEPDPAAFGGNSNLVSAGLAVEPASRPVGRKSRLLSILTRLSFLTIIAALCCAVISGRRRRRIAVALVLLVGLGIGELSFQTLSQVAAPWRITESVPVDARGALTYRLQPAAATRDALRAGFSSDSQLELFLQATGPVRISWDADGVSIPVTAVGPSHYAVSSPVAVETAMSATTWTITIENPGPTPVAITGWQRNPLPGRTLVDGADAPRLPAVEFRLRQLSDGFLALAAF